MRRNVSVLAAPWELHVQNVPSFHCSVEASSRSTHFLHYACSSIVQSVQLLLVSGEHLEWNCYEGVKGSHNIAQLLTFHNTQQTKLFTRYNKIDQIKSIRQAETVVLSQE